MVLMKFTFLCYTSDQTLVTIEERKPLAGFEKGRTRCTEMDLDHLQTLPIVNHGQPRQAVKRLEGGRLILARLVWLTFVALALVLFVINMPLYVRLLQTVCTHAAACPTWQPSLETASALHHLGYSLSDYAVFNVALTIISALLWIGIGLFMFWQKSNEWIVLVFSFHAVMQGIVGPNGYLDSLRFSHSILQAPATFASFLERSTLWLAFALFPNGRFVPRWMRWLLLIYIVIYLVSLFLMPSLLHSGPPGGIFIFLTIGSILCGQIYRYVRISSPTERQQTKWVVFSLAIVLVVQIGVVLPTLFFPAALRLSGSPYHLIIQTVDILITLIVPPSIAIALLRYQLWDIDIIINRTLLYGTLTASIVGIYVVVVVSLGALLQTSGNLLISLLATGLVAMLFQPLREHLQKVINHLMYGERDEPYTVMTRLSQRLEVALAPDAVPSTIVETVAQALKLPYAALLLKHEQTFVVAASYGHPCEDTLKLPLIYQAETIGQLHLAPRTPGEAFSPADKRLLDELARHAGLAAHAVMLTSDLQNAREHLVIAREEERRRLRRDLHDGLGSELTSVIFKLDATDELLDRDPVKVRALLAEARAQTQASVTDIRRLVYNLRPPILDEWGLVAALREHVAQNAIQNLQVSLDAPESFPPLSAAVEVAVYRIVLEALANVIKHAQASACTIRLALMGDVLTAEVKDNGVGRPAEFRAGVGMAAMYERAWSKMACLGELVYTHVSHCKGVMPYDRRNLQYSVSR